VPPSPSAGGEGGVLQRSCAARNRRILESCSSPGVKRRTRERPLFGLRESVRLEVVAKTTLPRPTLFHFIAWIAERRPPGQMAAVFR